MSNASQRNFAAAVNARSRRMAMVADGSMDLGTAINQQGEGPGWDAFFETMREKEDGARANGYNFRADLGGIGRFEGGSPLSAALYPTDRRTIAGNLALGDYTDRANAVKRGAQAFDNGRMDQIVDDLRRGYDESRLDAAFAPPEQPTDISRSPDGSTVTMRPAGAPESERDRAMNTLPGHLRAQMLPTPAEVLAERAAKLAEDKQRETVRANRAKEREESLLMPVGADGAPGVAPTGAAVLERLAPPVQSQIKALADGRMAFPTGAALKTPYWQKMLDLVAQFDPSFDAINYNARASTRKDFTSGKAAGQVNAINTVIGHLSDLAGEGEKLGNTGLNWVNDVYNRLTPGGSNRGVSLNNFETLKEGVANELMRVWRQVGAGSEKEIEDWKAQIGATKSPEELRGAFKTIGGMLESKLGALDNQYRAGMGTDSVSAISPESRARLDKLQGASAAVQAAPGAAPAAGGGPAGMVSMVAPDGRRLSVPAAKVAELEAHGAKRVQ